MFCHGKMAAENKVKTKRLTRSCRAFIIFALEKPPYYEKAPFLRPPPVIGCADVLFLRTQP